MEASTAFNQAVDILDNAGAEQSLNVLEVEELLKAILDLVKDSKKRKISSSDSQGEVETGVQLLRSRTRLLLGQLIEWRDADEAEALYSAALKDTDGEGSAEPLLELGRLGFKRATRNSDLEVARERLERCIAVAGVGDDNDDDDDDDDDDVESTGREASIYLARLLCQSPEHNSEAKRHLASLGYKYRLSPEVVLSSGPPCSSSTAQSPFVYTFDDALPLPLLEQLQKAFDSNSPFWHEHGYGSPTTGYFSYQLPFPLPRTTKPNLLSLTIERVYQNAVLQMPSLKEAKFCEWWAHSRHHNDGHSLHYDYILSDGKETRHPIASTVTYLQADCGGPTLVTDQTMDSPLSTVGFAVSPGVNRTLCFEGMRLHCVLPGREVRSTKVKRQRQNIAP